MRFRLRTLLVVLALGPPVLAAAYLYPLVFLVFFVSIWLIIAHIFEIGLRTYLNDEKRRRKMHVSQQRLNSNS